MVEEVSLQVGIDARPAAAGAASFKRSAAEIIRSAEKLGRAVDKAGGEFDNMKKAANDNSRTLAGTARSLREVETAVNSLSRSAEQIRSFGGAFIDLGDAAESAGDRLDDVAKTSINLGDVLDATFNAVRGIFEGLGAVLTFIKLKKIIEQAGGLSKAFKNLIGFAGTLFALLRNGVAVVAAFGAASAAALLPLAPLIAAVGILGGGLFALLKVTEEGRERQRRFNESVETGNRLLREAAEATGKVRDSKLELADAELAVQQAEHERAAAITRNQIAELRQDITFTQGDIVGDDASTPVPRGIGQFGLRSDQDRLRKLEARLVESEAASTGTAELRAFNRLDPPDLSDSK